MRLGVAAICKAKPAVYLNAVQGRMEGERMELVNTQLEMSWPRTMCMADMVSESAACSPQICRNLKC